MPARSNLLIITCALALVIAVASLYQLFSLRFEVGDLFPAGSSLRSDPLGSMAFFTALERTEGLSVERNYRRLTHQQHSGSTILFLGSGLQLLSNRRQTTELEAMAAAGNRILIAFNPAVRIPVIPTAAVPEKPANSWGIVIGQVPATEEEPSGHMLRADLVDATLQLPPEALFLSRLTLQPPTGGWRVIYAVAGKPVLLERTIGSGSLALVSDSSIFSNEALKEGRQTALLTWLLGENHRIVFDESHLGVTEQGGIMALARRFGLLPLLGALLALAGLYIWRQSAPLIPAIPAAASAHTLGVTHDSFSGLVNLLKRNIPPAQLLRTCCMAWKKSCSRDYKQDEALQNALDDAMAASADPVVRYQRIARLRAERTGR